MNPNEFILIYAEISVTTKSSFEIFLLHFALKNIFKILNSNVNVL